MVEMRTVGNMNQAYSAIISELLRTGVPVNPRGISTVELINFGFTLTNPQFNVVGHATRKLNLSFMAAEFMWMITGSNDARMITPYNKQLGKFSDDGLYFRGAYGPKLMDQIPYIIQTLRDDPFSRQAVLTLWRERPQASKDIPCTCLMQFFIRGGYLDMIVYMRSNDAWLGLPYDVFNFTMIQQFIAALLQVEPGWYHHQVGSMHLYGSNKEQAEKLLAESPDKIPVISNKLVVAPMPPEVMTVFTGISLLDKDVSAEDHESWLDLSGVRNYVDWLDLLELCCFKFSKRDDLLPPKYQSLTEYWRSYGAEQASPGPG